MVQQEYTFEDSHQQPKKSGIGKFIWNSETREFLGRDGASWAKITLFYAIFYTCLASFFVGLLAVFIKFMPSDRPTYIGVDSTMSVRGLNPGLGFRPQVDVEDHLISYNPSVAEHPSEGYKKYVSNLKNFLDAKYGPVADTLDVMDCSANKSYVSDLESGKSCALDLSVFDNTVCNEKNDFGYTTNKPCVLIKLNKIYTWIPEGDKGVEIECGGETSADKDNLIKVEYFSPTDAQSGKTSLLDKRYFPFFGQKSYRAPFVWARFDIQPNTLVNIECKAIASNIDIDRLNRRGQTKFSLFIKSK